MLPFSIGFGELFVIVVVVLLVVGPSKLPQIARTLGGGVRMARRATRELQDAIQAEELKEPLVKPWEDVVKARDEVLESVLSDELDTEEHHSHAKGVIDVQPVNEAVPQATIAASTQAGGSVTAEAASADTPATSERGRSDG